MNISESIINAQHIRRLKNFQAAKLANISGTYYSLLKSGEREPSLEVLVSLAKKSFTMKVSEFIALGESK